MIILLILMVVFIAILGFLGQMAISVIGILALVFIAALLMPDENKNPKYHTSGRKKDTLLMAVYSCGTPTDKFKEAKIYRQKSGCVYAVMDGNVKTWDKVNDRFNFYAKPGHQRGRYECLVARLKYDEQACVEHIELPETIQQLYVNERYYGYVSKHMENGQILCPPDRDIDTDYSNIGRFLDRIIEFDPKAAERKAKIEKLNKIFPYIFAALLAIMFLFLIGISEGVW